MEEYPNQWKIYLRPEGSELYDLILGLRWARNRMTHQVCQWEIAVPPFAWQDAESLAPIDTVERRYDRGRTQYEQHLQRKDAREALKRVLGEIKRKAVGALPP